MDVNELRLGNYLLYFEDNKWKIGKLVGISDCALIFDNEDTVTPKVCGSIKLDGSLLKKCGFVKESEYIYTHYSDEKIIFDKPNDWNKIKDYPIGVRGANGSFLFGFIPHEETIIRCLNLHQLQNMFYSITGKELEVNNDIFDTIIREYK